jgi:hypothetical protein
MQLPADLQGIIEHLAKTFDISPEQAIAYPLRDLAIGQGLLPPDDQLEAQQRAVPRAKQRSVLRTAPPTKSTSEPPQAQPPPAARSAAAAFALQ